jgi:hypothetical protein
LYNLFIRENTTNNDLIFSIEEDVKIWDGRLAFNIAPYMWWRDYPYRQRNVNRVLDLDKAIARAKTFNVPAQRYLLIISDDEKSLNPVYQKLTHVVSKNGFSILKFGP